MANLNGSVGAGAGGGGIKEAYQAITDAERTANNLERQLGAFEQKVERLLAQLETPVEDSEDDAKVVGGSEVGNDDGVGHGVGTTTTTTGLVEEGESIGDGGGGGGVVQSQVQGLRSDTTFGNTGIHGRNAEVGKGAEGVGN